MVRNVLAASVAAAACLAAAPGCSRREHHADARGRHVRARVGSGRVARRRNLLRRARRRLVLRLWHRAFGRSSPLRSLVDPGRSHDHQREAGADELHGLRLRRRPRASRELRPGRLLGGRLRDVEHTAGGRPGAAGASGGVAALRQPAQHLAGKPRRSIGIRQCGLLRNHIHQSHLHLGEPRDARRCRAGRRRQALRGGLHDRLRDAVRGRLSERAARAVLLPPLLQQGAIASECPAADRGVHRGARRAEPDPGRLHRRDRCVRDRARRRRLEPPADADRVHRRDLHRRRAPGWRDAHRRAGLGDDGCGRLLQRRRYRRDARRLRDR